MRKRALLAAAALLAAGATVAGLLLGTDEAAPAVGKLTAAGCIDDNDTGTDPAQGPDDCARSTNGLAGVRQVALSPDDRWLYAAAAEDHAIVRFRRNRKSGALRPRGCIGDTNNGQDTCALSTRGLAEPGSIVISEDGRSLYAVGEQADAVVRFNRNVKSGALVPRGCIDDNDTGVDTCAKSTDGLDGVTSLALSPDGRWLYAASETDDAIVRFKRNRKTGALAPRGCTHDKTDGTDNCGSVAGGLSGATGLAISPDGRWLVAVSEFDGAVALFKRQTRTGTLQPRGCLTDTSSSGECAKKVPGLSSPDAVTIGPEGRSVYVTSEGDYALTRFALIAKQATLKPRGCIEDDDTLTGGCVVATIGLAEPGAASISDDGRSLYVGSGGDDAIKRFKRNPDTGALDVRDCIDDNDTGTDPAQGEDDCARSTNGLAEVEWIVVTGDGRHAYAAAERDDAVVLFRRSLR